MLPRQQASLFSKSTLSELFNRSKGFANHLLHRRRQSALEQVQIRRRRRGNLIETLEIRALLSTFTVTSIGNSGAGTLRQAITDAESNGTADTIDFNIAGAGPHVISLSSSLPSISQTLVINGASAPDYLGSPVIEINGSLAGAADGVDVNAGASVTIRGLSIVGFSGHGIFLASGGNTIVGNYIGVRASGVALGNSGSGVMIQNTSGTTIGGTSAADSNVISNNTGHGILLNQAGATGNTILGNIIGLGPGGASAMGNSGNGISMEAGATGNTIGGTLPGAGNTIANNSGAGVYLSSPGGNVVMAGNPGCVPGA